MRSCVECGEQIPEERLRAKPDTKYCIDCQEIRESTGKFSRSKMKIVQEIVGYQCEDVQQELIRGE